LVAWSSFRCCRCFVRSTVTTGSETVAGLRWDAARFFYLWRVLGPSLCQSIVKPHVRECEKRRFVAWEHKPFYYPTDQASAYRMRSSMKLAWLYRVFHCRGLRRAGSVVLSVASLRAHRIVAAKRIANFRSSVIGISGRGREAWYISM